jgi:hypothetical protein
MNIPPYPVIRILHEDIQIMMGQLAKMEEAGEEWYFIKTSNLNTRIIPKIGLFLAIYLGGNCIFLLCVIP